MSSSSSTRSQTAIPDIESQESKVQNKVEESLELKSSQHEVTLEHHEHPQSLSIARKWLIVLVISSSALCVTCASSAASFTEDGVSETFHVSHEVTILAISLFVEGLGLGPLLAGPLSEVYGRNIIYRVSFVLLFAFSFGVAFAPNIVVYLVFRFITGFCGSTFLSVAGGSVSDLFDNKTVANPMAVYTISPFIGPVVGPLLSGFINQNTNWRWTYYTLIIWTFTQTFALFVFIPETYVPVLRKRKANTPLRKTTGDNRYFAPLEKNEINLAQAILISCYKPFQLVLYDRMALLLNTWTSLILGILYLAFQAFPVIFETNHGFNMQDTGLAFLGIGIGMLSGLASQPYWNRVYAREAEKNGGVAPPEARLYMGEIGGILTPFGLYFLAFTTYPSVHWIVPIIASVFFGAGIYFVFTCVFTYLVTAYRPIAASAMASNSAMRSTFAAVFPLFAGYMYDGLGTVGATALLAGVMTLTVPLPFVYRRIGPRLRAKSKFAVA
ncbi:major facilitator superfamily domain-containing protein [Lentinula aff. detonsa]|uniref:Major facilitator superfamily domain-containing protein n=1 Tax=Lentinula aff. detonsa TaxID=2804958 RepID=A0AA38KP28_9AGAR|nr:major facilitator superfamily domain-containing protein [Lentinula aff. detonsa]